MAEDRPRSLEEFIAENEPLRGMNSAMTLRIEALVTKIVELKKRLGRNSQNFSLPLSAVLSRAAKPESPNRATRGAMSRKPGKQPGSARKANTSQREPPTR